MPRGPAPRELEPEVSINYTGIPRRWSFQEIRVVSQVRGTVGSEQCLGGRCFSFAYELAGGWAPWREALWGGRGESQSRAGESVGESEQCDGAW